jgi:phage terminase large subunit GpA-like protein
MKKTKEERDFEEGIFWVPCPCCGYKQPHTWYEADDFFGCPKCHEFSWLRRIYLDRNCRIAYGLVLVKEI